MRFIKSLFIWALLSCVSVSVNVVHSQNILNPYRLGGIQSIDAIPSIRVPVGTAFASINFSDYGFDKVSALYTSGSISDVYITWFAGSYNSAVAGTYTVYGSLLGVNPNSITPSISVEVVALETEYQAILTQATTDGATLPTPINQGDQNDMIKSLKTLSEWTNKDAWYCMLTDGNSSFALYDWRNPTTRKATTTGSPTYTSRKGFTGNASSSFINTLLQPSTATNFTLNSAGFGAYIYDEVTTGTFLGVVASSARVTLQPTSAFSVQSAINDNTNVSSFNAYNVGYFHAYRTASNQINLNQNTGAIAFAASSTTIARPANNVYLLARNNAGTADSFSDGTVSMAWFGAASNTNQEAIHVIWQTYLLRARVKNTHSTPAAIGSLVNDTFARASLGSSYATTAGTWACDGVKMVESGGSSSNYNTRCLYKYGQSYENVTITRTITNVSTPGAGTGGTGVGWSDYSGVNGQRSIICKLDLSTGAQAGKVSIYTYDGTTATQQSVASTAIPTIAANNIFNITVTKVISAGLVRYDITATRVSDSASTTISYSSLLGDSTGDFGLFNFGSTINNTSFTVTVNDSKNKKLCVVGESREHGAFATSLALRYASNITTRTFEVSAGSGDLTGDIVGTTTTIIGKIKSLLSYQSEYYLIVLGSNDLPAVSFSIWQPSLRRIINALKNEGYKVIVACPIPRNDADVNDIYTFYTGSASLTNETKLNALYLSLKDASNSNLNTLYDNGDHVHINTLGHSTAAAAMVLVLPVLY